MPATFQRLGQVTQDRLWFCYANESHSLRRPIERLTNKPV